MVFRLLVVVWTSFLLLSASAPAAFADGVVVEPSWVAAESVSFDALDGGTIGDPLDVDGLTDGVRAAELRHERAISAPAAAEERADSMDAFTGLGRNSAVDLVTGVFADALEELAVLPSDPLLLSESPPRFNAGSDTSARIDPPGPDDSQLVVSSMPLRNEDGQIVSGQLEAGEDGFGPEAPLANVELPGRANGQIALTDVDVEFGFDGAAASAGSLVDIAEGSGKEMVFYPNTQTDTDTAISYNLTGLETFHYLRSADSPESFVINYNLPDGASLQASGDGAVAIDADGEVMLTVLPPFARDAQGSDVPVDLSIDGATMVLNAPHRSEDFAYPIMVDPVMHVRDWWNNGASAGFQSWSFYQEGTSNYNNSLACPSALASVDPCGGTGAGVYVSAVPSRSYAANSKGYWRWVAPGGSSSSITGITIDSWHYRKGNNNAGWAFYNLYNTITGTSNGQNITSGGGGGGIHFFGGNGYKYFHSGLMTNTTNTIPAGASKWRYNRLAAYTASLTDGEAPTLGLSGAPNGWLGPNTPFYPTATVHDPGLGMGWIQAYVGGRWVNKWAGWCLGTWPALCSTSAFNQSLAFNSNEFAEGTNSVPVKAIDIVSGSGHETTKNLTVKVDQSAPMLELEDEFAEVTSAEVGDGDPNTEVEELGKSVYRLTVSTDDRKTGVNSVSGIRKVVVSMNDDPGVLLPLQTVHEKTFGCSPNCAAQESYSWDLDLTDLQPGKYVVLVTVHDQAGNVRSRSVEFEYNPGTGIRDEYVMQYVELPDETEIAVNVANGNLVYRSHDLRVVGEDVDLEIERYYNSQAPSSTDTEWGSGWTMGQDPEIDGSASDSEITLQGETSDHVPGVEVPDETGDTTFSDEARAVVEKLDDDTLAVEPQESEDTLVFNDDGSLDEVESINGSKILYERDTSGQLVGMETNEAFAEQDRVVEVDLQSDLVAAVESDGENLTYDHDAQGNLTQVDDGTSTTTYEYTSDGLLKKIELEDGTVVQITYDEFKRALQVALTEPGQATKVTSFSYSNSILFSSKTTVTEPGGQVANYLISKTGAVIRSEIGPQTIDLVLSGSLWAAADQTLTGTTYTLAADANGGAIDRIEIQIDGAAVDEFTCESAPCGSLQGSIEVNTSGLVGGVSTIEAFAYRANGDSVSRRFAVMVPAEERPEDEGTYTPEPPTLEEALEFRETYDLDQDPTATAAINSNPSYWGSLDDWGVPLRASEIAELELREQYVDEAAQLIDNYVANHATIYAGYEVDHADGGKVKVGFTANQATHIANLKAAFSEPDRLVGAAVTPAYTLTQLEGKLDDLASLLASDPVLSAKIYSRRLDVRTNSVIISTDDPVQVTDAISQTLGMSGYSIVPGNPPRELPGQTARFSRFDTSGPMQAGDFLMGPPRDSDGDLRHCTAAFGARDRVTNIRGKTIWAHFILTAGHCYEKLSVVYRAQENRLGTVRRRSFRPISGGEPSLDSEAIRVLPKHVPTTVYISRARQQRIVGTKEKVKIGETICASGVRSNRVRCGPVIDSDYGEGPGLMAGENENGEIVYSNHIIPFVAGVRQGDSGGPVWDRKTGRAVGIIAAASDGYIYGVGRSCKDNVMTPTGSTYDCPIVGASDINAVENQLGVRVARYR